MLRTLARAFRPGLLLAVLLALVPAGALSGRGGLARQPGEGPCLQFKVSPSGQVGLVARDDDGNSIRLTYSENGSTNYTILRVDGKDQLFGLEADTPAPETAGTTNPAQQTPPVRVTQKRTFSAGITLTQEVKLVSDGVKRFGGPDEAPAVRQPCACVVTYAIENKGAKARKVGLCVIIDTMIGGNDANPFAVPGKSGMVTTFAEFLSEREIPRYVKALEKRDAAKPGAVAYLTLRLDGLKAPSRFYLTHRPYPPTWDFKVQDLGSDSAAVIYWGPETLKPKATLKWGYAYGLGVPSAKAEGGSKPEK
jgi:trimeric autotransporter adhesin